VWLQGSGTPERGKNRLHLDVVSDGDAQAEVRRLLRLGAQRADVGQTGAEQFTALWYFTLAAPTAPPRLTQQRRTRGCPCPLAMSFAAPAGLPDSIEKGTPMTEPKTHTLDVPGAVLHYDVREAERSTAPILLMIGSPMDASGFTSLVEHFRDRTVVTYDPRGIGRSQRADGAGESTPEQHADDLHRLISALGGWPVDIFASSGGAVNGLALVARHPEQVHTLVAHEPPAAQALPDREQALAAVVDIRRTYERDGIGAAMAKFIAISSLRGPIPADFADRPVPNPADFGMPTEDDGSRDDPMFAQNLMTCTHYEHDFSALRAASTRIVVGAGAESEGEMAHRAAEAVAERLGTKAVIFPSHHGGFLGGEFGMKGDPDAFAVTLRQVLTEEG
jgi:pimeloyl-ACP methyl ester carboxylesterase